MAGERRKSGSGQMKWHRLGIVLVWALTMACGGDNSTSASLGGEPQDGTPTNSDTDTGVNNETESSVDDGATASSAEDKPTATGVTAVGYTYHRADGNRLAAGAGGMPLGEMIDIALGGVPLWVVAAPMGQSSVWMVALEDGRIETFRIVDRTSVSVSLVDAQLPPGTPPVLAIEADLRPRLANIVNGGASHLSHPVLLTDDRLAYLTAQGELVLLSNFGEQRLALNALPDARILVDEDDRLLLYNQPTNRYEHAVLGDDLEAGGMVLVETVSGLAPLWQIDLDVGEGIAPLWADLDGDGRREIVATVSDAAQGARLVLFTGDGLMLASGNAIGQGLRWRHQLAIATFAGDEPEIAVVRAPHIGGIVEFYQRRGQILDIATQLDGYSSHLPGSRNLDMGLAGDFDFDGELELLLPTEDFTRLGAVERTSFGAEAEWYVSIGGRLSTNIAAVQQTDGGLLVGVGHEGEVLRIWLP